MSISKMPVAANPKDIVYPTGSTGENCVTEYLGKTWAGFQHMKSPDMLMNADAKFQKMDDKP